MEELELFALLLAFVAAVLAVLLGSVGAWFLWAARQLPAVQKGSVAFFHPFADGGGGGERVLWCAIQSVQLDAPSAQVYVYVRAGVSAEQLREGAAERFNVHIPRPFQVIELQKTALIEAERYSRFTLIGQALGSVRLGREALSKFTPEVYVDTTGWAFAYPLAWYAGCQVACYVHYPTISTNMIERVWSGAAMYNNDEDIAESPVKSLAKLLYYRGVALLYGVCGSFAHVVMVNSSWTQAHIQRLWWIRQPPRLVYPPVDTLDLQQLPLDRKLKQLFLVSVNQFRPEKNHRLQLEAYALARRQAGYDMAGNAVRVSRLKLVGGSRNAADEERIAALQALAAELQIADSVDWVVNASYEELRMLLGGAVGGLHTMVDEHFGISVVEYMAAGVLPIAHDSGGPRADIVVPLLTEEGEQVTGFLATTVEEYADAITKVLAMDQRERLKIAACAQKQAAQFSTERFMDAFQQAMQPLLPAA